MIIGIGGVSRSGKTMLASRIQEALPGSAVIHQDEFNASVLPEIGSHIDWEVPEAVDYSGLIEKLRTLRERNEHVIVEGILIFANPALNDLFEKRIVLTLDKQTFFERKSQDLRWGKEPDWYVEHIWNSHLKYGFPPDGIDFLMIDAKNPISTENVMNYLFSAKTTHFKENK